MSLSSKVLTTLLVLCLSAAGSSRPQTDDVSTVPEGRAPPSGGKPQEGTPPPVVPRDPLRWIWIDETSLELAWSSKFSLSLNDAVKGYGLSLTQPHQEEPFATTTIYSSTKLHHQFEGLKSNSTYQGKLEALVGPHHWPYNLLNFTFTSAFLFPGIGLGQRSSADRPDSITADLGKVSVGVTLRWSHSPFTTGALVSSEWDATRVRPDGLKPDGYLLQIWDQKSPMLKIVTSVTGKHDGCIASVSGLSLDTTYKATLQGLHEDGRAGTTLSFSLDAGGFYVAGGGLTTDGVSECYSGLQVKCPASDRCVSPYWICDGAPDCPNGEDEIGCDKSPCDGFRCWDNVCIPGVWRCDGHRDCKDGDDEYKCSSCNEGEMPCSTVGFCFYPNATCDGIPDCPDGWDESVAVCGGKECSPGELPCWDNDHCVQHSNLCDGTPDCPTSEDEDRSFCIAFKSMRETTTLAVDLQASLCEHKPNIKSTNCTSNEYQCESGECIPQMYLCNGYNDCQTGDDEEPNACSYYGSLSHEAPQVAKNATDADDSSETNCGKNMIQCPSGKCVAFAEDCAIADLCVDADVESGCQSNSTSNKGDGLETKSLDFNSEDEDGQGKYDSEKDNSMQDHSKTNVSENTTQILDANYNFTSLPVLKDLDLGSIEDENPHFLSPPSVETSQKNEGITTTIFDVSSEGYVVDFFDNGENSMEITPVHDSVNPVNTSIVSDNSSTVAKSLFDYDLLASFNVSMDENEIDEPEVNTSNILHLDSDEEIDNHEMPFMTVFPDTSLEEISYSEDGRDLKENKTGEIIPITQESEIGHSDFTNATEDISIKNENETGIATDLHVNNTKIDDSSEMPGSTTTTTKYPSTDIPRSTDVTFTEESHSVYMSSESMVTNQPTHTTQNITYTPEVFSSQSVSSKANEITATTDSMQTSATEETSTIDTQTQTSEEKIEYQSTTELVITDSDSSPADDDKLVTVTKQPDSYSSLDSEGILVTVTEEPDNWKDPTNGQKNLTILIAVHSIGDENKIPQYIIHGVDGNTYEYEVVGVNDDDKANKTEIGTDDDEHTSHEFSSGIHELSYLHDKISSGTKLSCSLYLLISFVYHFLHNM